MERKIEQEVRGYRTKDGAGVSLVRVLGHQTVQEYDPILLLDSFDSMNPEDYTAGFPMHPHRGIETISYIYRGFMTHRDSLGNEDTIGDGEVQWMTAGSGIMHEEKLPAAERMLGVQLWLNLPAKDKMVPPAYRSIKNSEIEEIEFKWGKLRLLAGEFEGRKGYMSKYLPLDYYDLHLNPNASVVLNTEGERAVMVFTLLGDAYIGKFTNEQVEVAIPEYIDELEKSINEAREAHGQKALKKNEKTAEIKDRKVSTTDPDSGYMFRDRKPRGFFYLNHMAVDGENNLITSVLPTTAAINDAVPFLGIIERLKEKYDLKYIGADAAYYTAAIAKGLKDMGIKAAIAKKLGPKPAGKMSKLSFVYVEDLDIYVCPEGSSLNYRTTTRDGYKEYCSNKDICDKCPKREKCIYDNQNIRTIRRHVWQE
jgi:redox-sensitive bicupin YhaK (pirin superfamily)